MKPWTVVDLFSGAGGMSCGFHAQPDFRVVGAVDAQIGKPSSGNGASECNSSYRANIGITPLAMDLMTTTADDLAGALAIDPRDGLTVLCSCAPCTGFSRTNSRNHIEDDTRNTLVGRTASFVEALQPRIVLMENARELIRGNFGHHFAGLERDLRRLGYEVHAATHVLSRFGLPQQRERAFVIATRRESSMRTLEDLWSPFRIEPGATHVRRAIGRMPPLEAGRIDPHDPMHASPAMGRENRRRLELIPKDGGSWADLRHHPERDAILTGAMSRRIAKNDFGSHPDIYGRMAWDKPAPTIKRECGHVGNGRYAHPEQDRLCTVREMAILQGFPRNYAFEARSLANRYRHIGDAVPPLISYQLAALCRWMLTGRRPTIPEMVLPHTHLRQEDILPAHRQRDLFAG